MNLFLKPLVCHATIPANSRRIPDKFPKCPRNPAKPSILDTSGFASGFIERKVQEPFSQTSCMPRNNSRQIPEKFPPCPRNPANQASWTQVVFYERNLKLRPQTYLLREKTSKNNVTHM